MDSGCSSQECLPFCSFFYVSAVLGRQTQLLSQDLVPGNKPPGHFDWNQQSTHVEVVQMLHLHLFLFTLIFFPYMKISGAVI